VRKPPQALVERRGRRAAGARQALAQQVDVRRVAAGEQEPVVPRETARKAPGVVYPQPAARPVEYHVALRRRAVVRRLRLRALVAMDQIAFVAEGDVLEAVDAGRPVHRGDGRVEHTPRAFVRADGCWVELGSRDGRGRRGDRQEKCEWATASRHASSLRSSTIGRCGRRSGRGTGRYDRPLCEPPLRKRRDSVLQETRLPGRCSVVALHCTVFHLSSKLPWRCRSSSVRCAPAPHPSTFRHPARART
jgi:hypothetical protein